jgi:hypothetical protein
MIMNKTVKAVLAAIMLTALFSAALLFSACPAEFFHPGEKVSIAVIGVTLNKTTLDIDVDDTENFTAIFSPANSTNKGLTWTSSNTDVVTVSSKGAVTGVAEGTAIIIVTTQDGNKTAACSVTVIDPVTPAKLAAHLNSLPSNTVSSPHTVLLKVRSVEEFDTVEAALKGAPNKYVYLDLSRSTIDTIPNMAFSTVVNENPWTVEGCATLIGINIPNGITSIEGAAFMDCSKLASVNIPNSVTSIDWNAFSRCTSLASVTIPDGVTSIKVFTFEYCESLISVTIPDGVTIIENGAFHDCTSLISVSIPNSVTIIEYSVFNDCYSLASVTIPSSVTSIGDASFQSCLSLNSVTFQGTIPSSGFNPNNSFPGDLRAKFYASNPSNGTPGTYTTLNPGWGATWTRQ